MVKPKEAYLALAEDNCSLEQWLSSLTEAYPPEHLAFINKAVKFLPTPEMEQSGKSSGLAIAVILAELNLDYEALTAAILYLPLLAERISIEQIKTEFNPNVGKLLQGVCQLNNIRDLQTKTVKNRPQEQADKLRKMLVAMVDDVRVVLIKLAERLNALREANQISEEERQAIAQEVNDIYAPLANRLGVWQLKWELEDLAFRYLQPQTYKEIAKTIKSRRIERDNFIQMAMDKLRNALVQAGLEKFDISGRAKHIYSIYKKMQRKDVDYQEIYDASAIRVLVPQVADCYMVLSIVHDLWQQIPQEFDDYIYHPKPNGYRSIHTAVVGPGENNLEVQIRTYAMHEESELGVAAHWAYKEGKAQKPEQLDKIAWLRQVLDWQKELITYEQSAQQSEVFENQVYVFSPAGDVIDLAKGATPLDFAYAIHSQIGHRCKGAKVNGSIVPLTYQLQTGDQVEILTAKLPNPSRDWMNPHTGYLATSRARARVQQWFKQQDYDRHLADGHDLLTKELQRLNVHELNLEDFAHKLQCQNAKDLYASLGNGSLRLSQITGMLTHLKEKTQAIADESFITKPSSIKKSHVTKSAVSSGGIDDLLTHMAGCCKPVPGDKIVGYITQGHGISVHRQDCTNIAQGDEQRLLEVNWNELSEHKYAVELNILAQDRPGLLRDITTSLSVDKINIAALTCQTSKTHLTALVHLTVEVIDTKQLEQVIQRLSQLPLVLTVTRAE